MIMQIMIKILLITIPLFLAASTALAEKLVIELASGNTIIVEYAGSINTVTMRGESDSIAAINLESTAEEPATWEKSGTVAEGKSGESLRDTPSNGQFPVRLRWADPGSED